MGESQARLLELNANLEWEVIARSAVGRQFWEISPDLLGVLKPNAFRANPAWLTNLGWMEAEVQSMSIFELLHPDDVEPTRGGFEYLKQGNPIFRFENRYRAKDGSYRWFAWAAAPHGDAYYCSGRDITAEKEQAQALLLRQEEHELLWRYAQDLLVIIDTQGIFQDVSGAAQTILGYQAGDMIAKSVFDFIHPDDVEPTYGALAHATKAALPIFVNRYQGRLLPLAFLGGGADALAAAQDALPQSQKMEAVGQLTGGIAHDFNNLVQRFHGSNHIRRPRRVCRTKCGRRDGD